MHRLNTQCLFGSALFRGGPYCMTEASLTTSDSTYVVNIMPDARVATDAAGRWEIASKTNPLWRWCAGGALPIIRLRDAVITPLQLTQSSLPVWASHLTAATGIAGSIEEWVYPRRLIREAFEEVVIATPEGIVLPVFGDQEIDALAFGTIPLLRTMLGMQKGLPDIFGGSLRYTQAKLIPLRGEKDIVIQFDARDCSATRAVAVIDPATRGIDLMFAFELDLQAFTLDEISIFLAEDVGGRPADGEMACLELDDDYQPGKIVRTFNSGLLVAGTGDLSKLTPALRGALFSL